MTCVHCNEPATMRCKTHRQHICGDPKHMEFHRWDGREACDFFPIFPKRKWEGMDWVVAIGSAIFLVVGVAVVVVHL